ncbi:hypothetical protein Dthio_PD0046 [Desulfonatronospira thiodismutans ASO3-1]|uniref:Uncharacterized protein n=1 Tax=Desulfonatronospira thiodismutans ASO3-1 TaxID=555779 RepID=D6SV01_9BACT|nr:hypothetical protein Dthio_PD0046 [Desulfonatronospira thiodismutans ASO3-1]
MSNGSVICKVISVIANIISECLREDQNNKDKED